MSLGCSKISPFGVFQNSTNQIIQCNRIHIYIYTHTYTYIYTEMQLPCFFPKGVLSDGPSLKMINSITSFIRLHLQSPRCGKRHAGRRSSASPHVLDPDSPRRGIRVNPKAGGFIGAGAVDAGVWCASKMEIWI